MNTNKLKSIMVLHGDTGTSLAKAIGMSSKSLSAKLNGKKAEFTQSEIMAIKDRYKLSAAEIDHIFFGQEVS